MSAYVRNPQTVPDDTPGGSTTRQAVKDQNNQAIDDLFVSLNSHSNNEDGRSHVEIDEKFTTLDSEISVLQNTALTSVVPVFEIDAGKYLTNDGTGASWGDIEKRPFVTAPTITNPTNGETDLRSIVVEWEDGLVLYNTVTIASTTVWFTSDAEGTNIVYGPFVETGNGHNVNTDLLETETTYYAFIKQTTSEGDVSVDSDSVMFTTGDAFRLDYVQTIGDELDNRCEGIAVDDIGNTYVVGRTPPVGGGSDDIYVAKIDLLGAIVWQKRISDTDFDIGYAVSVDASGNVYIAGATRPDSVYSTFIAKLDSLGGVTWQKTIGGTGTEYGYGVSVDSTGNVYVTGYTTSAGAGLNDLFIAKLDSLGEVTWQKTIGGTGNEYGYGVSVDGSGNVYVAGRTDSAGAGGADLFLAKLDSLGEVTWQKTIGGTGTEYGYGVSVDSTGNVYVTGYTSSAGAGGDDIFLAALGTTEPPDGTLTNLPTLAIADAGLTVDDAGLTVSTSSLTVATSALTIADAGLTVADANLTQTISPL